jgi:hypothetical protein
VVKNNIPRRAQRDTEKKNSVPLRALCGKKNKLTTENTERHREKNPPCNSVPSVVKNNIPQRAQRNTERKTLRALCGKKNKLTTESTERHREKPSVQLRVLCGKENTPHKTMASMVGYSFLTTSTKAN